MALERASIGDVQAVGLALSDLQESLSSAQETRLLESVPAQFSVSVTLPKAASPITDGASQHA